MSELKIPVQAFDIDYACDVSGCQGFMRPTGAMLFSNPPKYPHRCDVCDAPATFDHTYPAFGYRRISAEG